MTTQYLCRLDGQGYTFTSLEAFNWVAAAAERTRALFAGSPITARLWSRYHCGFGNSRLVLRFEDEHQQSDSYEIQVGVPSELSMRFAGVPDMPDALHLAGMLLRSVGASLQAVGRRDAEKNQSCAASPSRHTNGYWQMALANFEVPRAQTGARGVSESRAPTVVAASFTKTPTSVFNTVAQLVAEFRQNALSAQHSLARIYAWRDEHDGAEGIILEVVRPGMEASQVPAPHFPRSYHFQFCRPAPGQQAPSTSVESLGVALHMIGMLLEACGIERIELGMFRREQNDLLFDAPLGRGQKVRPMALADHMRIARSLAGAVASGNRTVAG